MTDSQADPCTFCCGQCRLAGPSSQKNTNNPFATRYLLPAGSLILSIRDSPRDDTPCDHLHLDDGWHAYGGAIHSTILAALQNPGRDSPGLDQLRDLVEREFIAVRCRITAANPHTLFLRIYIIPYDLAGVLGRLRQREDAILVNARPLLRDIFSKMSRCPHQWDSKLCPVSGCAPVGFLPSTSDNRTLADIYAGLDSPVSPDSFLNSNSDVDISIPNLHRPYGLKTSLYAYQRETVAAMVYREMDKAPAPDPLYIPLDGLHGKTFFIQPSSLEILRERPQIFRPRGGILCEELGTGKTIMILALILSTLNQLPSPEASLSAPITLTPLACRHFPGLEHAAVRRQARQERRPEQPVVPTLLELTIHLLSLHPELAREAGDRDELPAGLAQVIRRNVPFYLHDHEVVHYGRGQIEDPGPRVVYLTSATLVVVPPNLVAQWVSEIHKHVSNEIRFLVVREHDDLPPVLSMASEYDIVLLSHARIAREEARFKPEALHTWTLCTCTSPPGPRVPICTCADRKDVSPLAQIRWKRLVVDEGHVHGTPDTRISIIAAKLNVERRWLVSGTPAKSLLGLSFGIDGRGEDSADTEQPLAPIDGKSDKDISGLPRVRPPSVSELIASGIPWVRVWNQADRDDLHRLHMMLVYFLKDERFMADHQLFKSHVVKALCERCGPQPGAIQVLSQLMNNVMIRHRIEDVQREIILPALHEETIVLEMDPMIRTSYNALQAVIVFNAVDSERVDQDYLFHPSNVSRLRGLVENMSQLMFWHIDEDRYRVAELSADAESMLRRAAERNVAESDIELLKNAIRHIAIAKEDSTWAAVQTLPVPEVPYEIEGIPSEVSQAWAGIKSIPEGPRDIMFPYHLSKLTAIVTSRPLIFPRMLVDEGHAQAREDERRDALFNKQASTKKAPSRKGRKGAANDKTGREAMKAQEAAKAAGAPEKMDELRREANATLEWATNASNAGDATTAAATAANASSTMRARLLRSSVLKKARILHSRSPKLNYILSEACPVLKYGSDEKFLIFSKSPLTLAHIADALSLAHVKYISHTSEMKVENRQQAVTTFETSDTYRVFLMEIKHGSHGLNLVSASRIIFCEPVWRADVEAQAIKRVHRIGQHRPISVKTLVIRGTPEELIVSRRSELKSSHQKQTTHFSEDESVRRFIEHPTFIEESDYLPLDLSIPLLDMGNPAEQDQPTREIQVDSVGLGMSAFEDLVAQSVPEPTVDPSTRPLKIRKVTLKLSSPTS